MFCSFFACLIIVVVWWVLFKIIYFFFFFFFTNKFPIKGNKIHYEYLGLGVCLDFCLFLFCNFIVI